MPPDWIANRNRSRRNCGLPPDRLRHDLEHVRRQRMLFGRQLRHPQRVAGIARGFELDARDSPTGATKPAAAGRRATPNSHRCVAAPARNEEQFGRRLVHVVRVLDLDRTRVRAGSARETRRPPRAASARRFFSASISTSGGRARTRDQRRWRSAATRAATSGTFSRRRREARCATASSGSSRPKSISSRSRSRHTAYGVETV